MNFVKKILLGSMLSATVSCTALESEDISTEMSGVNLIDQQLSQFTNIYNYGNAVVVGGEIHLTSTGNWFFLTRKKYRNFIFEGEVKMPDVKEYSNSGIMFRAQIKTNRTGQQVAFGYQAEVDPSNRQWSGGLYDQGRRGWLNPLHKKRSKLDADFKQNFTPQWTEERANSYQHLQWNKYRIECRGSDLKIFVNGLLTTHVTDVKDAEGYIGIQHHGSKMLKQTGKTTNIVKFRHLRITELK